MVIARRKGNPMMARGFLALLACAGIVTARAQNISSAQDRAQMMQNQTGLGNQGAEPTGPDNSHAVATRTILILVNSKS